MEENDNYSYFCLVHSTTTAPPSIQSLWESSRKKSRIQQIMWTPIFPPEKDKILTVFKSLLFIWNKTGPPFPHKIHAYYKEKGIELHKRSFAKQEQNDIDDYLQLKVDFEISFIYNFSYKRKHGILLWYLWVITTEFINIYIYLWLPLPWNNHLTNQAFPARISNVNHKYEFIILNPKIKKKRTIMLERRKKQVKN